jgi:hypothetical protein
MKIIILYEEQGEGTRFAHNEKVYDVSSWIGKKKSSLSKPPSDGKIKLSKPSIVDACSPATMAAKHN